MKHVSELTRLLEAGDKTLLNARAVAAMRRRTAAEADRSYRPEPGGWTWIWSDLHLHHANIIHHCDRPFAPVHQMDLALLQAWREAVGAPTP